MDPSILIDWKSPFPILGVAGVLFHFYFIFDENFMLANSEDPDHTPRSESALFAYVPKKGRQANMD